MSTSVYVCNVSEEEKPLIAPELNFAKPAKQDKQNDFSGQADADDTEEEPLDAPAMNFGKD